MTIHRFVYGTLLAVNLLLPSAQSVAADCAGMEAKVGAAKTAADHTAIASCYEDMAKSARAEAEKHKAMGQAYSKDGGAPAAKLRLPEHCDLLAKNHMQAAATYEQLAAAHREMAKSAK